MSEKAVYAGSFDPPTNGHVWMIERGARLFGHLVVAVAQNPEKQYSFPLEQRLGWLREVCDPFDNVEIADIQNKFLAHYAREVGARHILRGIRDEEDYRYERGMRYINSDLNAEATTVFLMPPRSLGQVSSSFVKGMIGPEGWEPIVRGYVPGCVFEDLVAWDAERGARSRA
jgi:pantetheine-phosphate adenylyltransferase